jgi:hypothetical protein
LTISSIAVAVVSYYVAKNSYDVAKQTYDDAVSSGKEQKAAMDTELATLQGQKAALEGMARSNPSGILLPARASRPAIWHRNSLRSASSTNRRCNGNSLLDCKSRRSV